MATILDPSGDLLLDPDGDPISDGASEPAAPLPTAIYTGGSGRYPIGAQPPEGPFGIEDEDGDALADEDGDVLIW